ncbi:antitermination protein [Photorhabdus temperata]|uniref:Phage antitermination protein Q n=1 Tax=Photorhabdus temperata subsp. temperata Meg1 TaxID=1393735 RepID=A0A081RR06_PHOTE|nr:MULTISPECIES: antiterminator Q family protein [Photorhabdus]KER01109.1 Phage antitermination protein Q [Photorhabdus temperata subsp. temperata Meg1]MCC8421988.1 antitermination protein [Photorhabdus thracensis]MCT8349872.1 antitermination protein [Photorhabdus temperata]
MRDIQMVLERWGSWAANDNSDVDWSPIAAGFKGLIPNKAKSRPQCCDDDGLAVDAAMRRLKDYNAYYFQLIVMYYVRRMPLRIMGPRLGISHNQVAKRLQSAEGFIEGCLAIADIKLEIDEVTQKENIYQFA